MSRQNHGRKLTEWADLIGASLPDSVAECEDASAEFYGEDGFGGGLGDEIGGDITNRSGYEFAANPDESE